MAFEKLLLRSAFKRPLSFTRVLAQHVNERLLHSRWVAWSSVSLTLTLICTPHLLESVRRLRKVEQTEKRIARLIAGASNMSAAGDTPM